MLGLSSAQRYCPKVLLGGAVPALAAASASCANRFAFKGLLGALASPFLLLWGLGSPSSA